MAKKYNFYAGPAILPQEVMKKAQDELLDFNGIGLSIMEISHRSKDFEAVINTAEAKIRSCSACRRTTRSCSCRAAPACSSAWSP